MGKRRGAAALFDCWRLGAGAGGQGELPKTTPRHTCTPPNPLCSQELAEWNRKYADKHGHIFIICASGKSAEEMLVAIRAR